METRRKGGEWKRSFRHMRRDREGGKFKRIERIM